MKIWDISPSITQDIAVFPGDIPFAREVSLSFPQNHLTLSSVRTTLHLGAHADSSSHYHAQGVGVDQRPLERYLGQCQVMAVDLPRGARILPRHVGEIKATRVLFKTGSFPNPNAWNNDFNSLSPELIEHLAEAGVVTVGIDTPSVDPADSQGLESHQALFRRNLAVLEGIILDSVSPGLYTLVALPLPLKDADASPVRAILLEPDLFPVQEVLMRKIFLLALPLVLLAACSGSTPERANDASSEEKAAASETDDCLDNPELARTWGDCNVKHTLYSESAAFAKCRRIAPAAKGTVTFELRVKGDGRVRGAKALGGNKSPKLVACLTNVMKQLQFAPTPKGNDSTIQVPYQL